MAPTLPDTFRSETALAGAVDAAFAEALAEELAAAMTAPQESAPAQVRLPDTDVLIAQAGIATGPCPPDPKTPSRSGRAARTALRLAGRAAWWLVKGAVCVTALVLVQTVRGLRQLSAPAPPEPAPRASDFLAATSAHLTEVGWTQYRLTSPAGRCLIGAERDLIRTGTGTAEVAARANDYLRASAGCRSIPLWNDGLTRREEHIHTALYRAAARARAAGD
ncbi:hypothetical protein ABZ686_02365 [Streptomyces sp. NPDC006992]|uniref:DUF6197 family protein n=1 Tax=Streptomyces sp. NPDC006992 TaxID=3155601 RepID=UPI00340883D8